MSPEGHRNFLEKFLENLKIVEVQKSEIIQPKIPGGKSNGTEIYSKIFPEILENFVYSSLEIQPSIFYRIESAQFVTCCHMLKFHDSEKNCRTRKGHYDITLDTRVTAVHVGDRTDLLIGS